MRQKTHNHYIPASFELVPLRNASVNVSVSRFAFLLAILPINFHSIVRCAMRRKRVRSQIGCHQVGIQHLVEVARQFDFR
jgi:hypothetical protein